MLTPPKASNFQLLTNKHQANVCIDHKERVFSSFLHKACHQNTALAKAQQNMTKYRRPQSPNLRAYFDLVVKLFFLSAGTAGDKLSLPFDAFDEQGREEHVHQLIGHRLRIVVWLLQGFFFCHFSRDKVGTVPVE